MNAKQFFSNSVGATQRSYQIVGQATDAIIMQRLKKKLGNNSYILAKRDVRNSESPCLTPTSKMSMSTCSMDSDGSPAIQKYKRK